LDSKLVKSGNNKGYISRRPVSTIGLVHRIRARAVKEKMQRPAHQAAFTRVVLATSENLKIKACSFGKMLIYLM
jgi:hypothetical protein